MRAAFLATSQSSSADVPVSAATAGRPNGGSSVIGSAPGAPGTAATPGTPGAPGTPAALGPAAMPGPASKPGTLATPAAPGTPAVRDSAASAAPSVPAAARPPALVSPRGNPLGPEATVELLERVKGGDNQALERLLERCIPALTRWARGRLPDVARGALDTGDLVQETVMAALRRLDVFEARHQGALQAYLRQALTNRIRDAVRHRMRRPQAELPDEVLAEQTSPLERLIGAQHLAIYDAALQRLRPADREALVGRMELQYSYEQLAIALGKPSSNAARVAVTRAIKRLVEEIRHER